MTCLTTKLKLLYHNRVILLDERPESYSALQQLCTEKIPDLLPHFLLFAVSAQGRRQLYAEIYSQTLNGPARISTFEVMDASESDRVNIRPFCLVGFQCLHSTAFMMQVYDLDSFRLQTRVIEAIAGFSYVVTENSLVITGGMGDFACRAIKYTEGVIEALPDLLTPHCFHLSLSHRQQLYILGGKDGKQNPTKKCEILDLAAICWTPLPDLSRKVVQVMTGCYVAGTIYILAGCILERLEASGWTVALTLEKAFLDCPVVPISTDTMLVYGGRSDQCSLTIQLPVGTIQEGPVVPARGKLHYFVPARHRNRVYLYAGRLDQVVAYNVAEKQWRFFSEECWTLRKGLFFAHSSGRREGNSSIWKLPPSLIRQIAGEYLL